MAAQFNLAKLYAKGEGVAKDPKSSAAWYEKAAEQGNQDAQMHLATMYIRGAGVPKDSKVSAKWYLMAAEQGNPTAQCQVARMHMMGAGLPKDDVQAYKWANLAAASGDASAKKIVVLLETRMTRPHVAEAQELTRVFLEMKKIDLPQAEPPHLETLDPSKLEPDFR
jgi:TPR repeat protein